MATTETEVKPKVERVSLNVLKRDYKFYPRNAVDFMTVHRFVEAMKAGAIFPPMRVDPVSLRIIDGFHRYAAYSELGVDMVDVVPEEVKDDADFFMRAVAANRAHGLGYSSIDYEKIAKIAKLLKLEREKIAFAMALPVQSFDDLVRNVPKVGDGPVKVGDQYRSQNRMDRDSEQGRQRTSVPKGYFFFFNQVIQFLQSEDCDLTKAETLYKIRELEDALQKRINPEGKQLTPLVLPAPVKDYITKWALREKKDLTNHVVEQLTFAVDMDIEANRDEGMMSAKQAEELRRKLKPYMPK